MYLIGDEKKTIPIMNKKKKHLLNWMRHCVAKIS